MLQKYNYTKGLPIGEEWYLDPENIRCRHTIPLHKIKKQTAKVKMAVNKFLPKEGKSVTRDRSF